MVQVIPVAGAESPLFQSLQGIMFGLDNFRQIKEQQRLQALQEEEIQRRQDTAELQRNILLANLMRENAANTPINMAPGETAAEAGLPEVPPDAAGPPPDQLQMPLMQQPPELPGVLKGSEALFAARRPQRQVTLDLPGGRRIPLAPLQYKEEVEADKLRTLKATQEATADVTDIPDVEEWGGLRGMKGVRTSMANAYLQALQRRDAAEALKLQRQAIDENKRTEKQAALDLKAAEKQEKIDQREAEAQGWYDSLKTNGGILKDVPTPELQSKVKLLAQKEGFKIPTRELSEQAIVRLNDARTVFSKLDRLDELESGYGQWIQQKIVPDALTQLTGVRDRLGWGEKAKIYEPAYFLFAAEMLKATQGSRPSDFDMKTYLNVMPKIGDPPRVKAAKVAQLRAALMDRYNKEVKSFADLSFNVAGFNMIENNPAYMKPGAQGGNTLTPMQQLLKKYNYQSKQQ